MEPTYIALLLLIVGLGLLVAEFFIPSSGMIFVFALIVLTASIWFAWRDWGWYYVAVVVVLLPLVIGGMLYVLPRTAVGRRILLEAPSLDEVTPFTKDEVHLSELIGREGKTLTLLNPGGLVLLNGERMHCESEGMMIDPDSDVRIIGVNGNRLVVRLSALDASPGHQTGAGDGSSGELPLDFELPQG